MKTITENSDMNKTFKLIYAILHGLDKGMDDPAFRPEKALAPDRCGISGTRWKHYMIMLQNAGYIDGVEVRETIDGETEVDISRAHITLSGLQYLAENAMMVRAYKAFREARGLLPH